MRKLSIKDIIAFRGMSDVRKKTFALKLKTHKEKIDSEGGGDYWISCLSAISNGFKFNDNSVSARGKAYCIEEKMLRSWQEKHESTRENHEDEKPGQRLGGVRDDTGAICQCT
jgi:hypothetical protein